jgi:carbamoyltransferase
MFVPQRPSHQPGALEFGPRALGHRSILAAPHHAGMRDRLNREIKYREQFRPFAPVVPVEVADRYFEMPPGANRLARFMRGAIRGYRAAGSRETERLRRSASRSRCDLRSPFAARESRPALHNERRIGGRTTRRRTRLDTPDSKEVRRSHQKIE